MRWRGQTTSLELCPGVVLPVRRRSIERICQDCGIADSVTAMETDFGEAAMGGRRFKARVKKFVESMDGFEWLVHLDEPEMREFLNDLRAVLENDEDGDVLTEVSFRLYEWKASAEVLSDPELVEILTEPVPEPLGTPAADYLKVS